MMRIVDFEEWHLGAVDQRVADYIEGPGFMVQLASKTTRAVTVLLDERPIAIFGVCMPYPGLGYVWARVNDQARGHGIALTKAARECLVRAGVTLPLRQLRAEVERSKPEYMRWATLLGFEPESIKKGAAPDGGDLVEYVRWVTSSVVAEVEVEVAEVPRPRRTTDRCGRTIPNGSPMSRPAALAI